MSMMNTAIVGTVAGMAGGQALDRVAQFMYDRTDPENVRRETEVEPRDPFVVLTQKVAGAGTAYVAASRRWSLGWLAGGALFGTLFWLIEDEGVGPALGLAGDNTKYPVEAHVRGLVAHVAFGVTAALVTNMLGGTKRRAK